MTQRRTIWIALAAVLVVTGGCGGSSNAGGSTKCTTFQGMSSSDQDGAVAAMTKAHGDKSAVGLVKLSVKGFCLINPNRNIDGVYGG